MRSMATLRLTTGVVFTLVGLTACGGSSGVTANAPSAVGTTSAGPAAPTGSVTATAITRQRDGLVKSPPTTHVKQTDEFGLVVGTERVAGELRVTIDRVDSLTGVEGEQAAKRRGQDYSNDHFEVNDSARTRTYALAANVTIWQAFPEDKRISVEDWLAYLRTDLGRQSMFHLELEGGQVIAIEQQYFP